MGRTVKISELKEFDVFSHHGPKLYEGKQYCFVGLGQFININNPQERYWYYSFNDEDEVELLGRMIFQEDGVSEILAEKKYKEECEDFVNNGP
jgi:NAD(P)H-flavin reductase